MHFLLYIWHIQVLLLLGGEIGPMMTFKVILLTPFIWQTSEWLDLNQESGGLHDLYWKEAVAGLRCTKRLLPVHGS